MSVNLSDLDCQQYFPVAGAKNRIWVIRWEDVLYVPKSVKGAVIPATDPVLIKPNTAFRHYDLQKDSVSWSENSNETPHGTYYDQVLSGFRPKNEPAHSYEILKLNPGYYILYFTDNEGQIRLLGDLDYPFRFNSKSDIDANPGGTNGTEWSFKAKSKRPVPHIDPSTDIPNELQIPFAKLNVNDAFVSKANPCLVVVNAYGSMEANGTLIDPLTSGHTLWYSWAFGTDVLYKAYIQPGANALFSGNWTYVSGSRSASDFQSEIVANIQSGGIGIDFEFDSQGIGSFNSPTILTMSLYINDGSNNSNTDTKTKTLCTTLASSLIHDGNHDIAHN